MERCLFCGKNKLRMYRLPDSESRHLFCDGCGAAGPWGDTAEEARALYEAARPATIADLQQELDESGDYAACFHCGEVWPNEMLRDDQRLPEHNFGNFRAPCAGSQQIPVAPTIEQVRQWKASQQ